MLNQPISSPMMKTMFGFLPLFAACCWAARLPALASSKPLELDSEQHSPEPLAGTASACLLPDVCLPPCAASADQFHGLKPLATPYPSSPPAARKIRAWTFGLLNMSPPSLNRVRNQHALAGLRFPGISLAWRRHRHINGRSSIFGGLV